MAYCDNCRVELAATGDNGGTCDRCQLMPEVMVGDVLCATDLARKVGERVVAELAEPYVVGWALIPAGTLVTCTDTLLGKLVKAWPRDPDVADRVDWFWVFSHRLDMVGLESDLAHDGKEA